MHIQGFGNNPWNIFQENLIFTGTYTILEFVDVKCLEYSI